MSDVNTIVWEFLQKQFIFIVAAISAAATFIKYVTKKHDERYDNEIRRLDTKIDSFKELILSKINDLKDSISWRKGDSSKR